MNSRHPCPRRVWKGGHELQSMPPLCRIAGLPGIAADEFKIGRISCNLQCLRSRPTLSRYVFVNFLTGGTAAEFQIGRISCNLQCSSSRPTLSRDVFLTF